MFCDTFIPFVGEEQQMQGVDKDGRQEGTRREKVPRKVQFGTELLEVEEMRSGFEILIMTPP